MIVVNVRKDGITIEGHANYAEYGKDIVCAGMTAIMRTFVKSIEDLTEDKIESKTLVDSFFVGVCMIANEYPEYVKIT